MTQCSFPTPSFQGLTNLQFILYITLKDSTTAAMLDSSIFNVQLKIKKKLKNDPK